ncbi:MAG TPA: dienelactone hydrolase family protein [Gammaproteobacteria bacterium]|nr:dienelactone hydrolase family protein [Gammaproteobacteria bacterium]
MTQYIVDTEHPLLISSGKVHLEGSLHIPKNAAGLVLFVHGSGSSRFSARNQHVARVLNDHKLATLLFDLLTSEEEKIDNHTRELRFDIDFLSSRLIDATQWCHKQPAIKDFPIGYFGASTGGAAALVAAAQLGDLVKAVVSRGGRPDLAGKFLHQVKAATLLIVGGNDHPVIEMNKDAFANLTCLKEIKIVPGATHLFEEPGTLDEVAKLARKWFVQYL